MKPTSAQGVEMGVLFIEFGLSYGSFRSNHIYFLPAFLLLTNNLDVEMLQNAAALFPRSCVTGNSI